MHGARFACASTTPGYTTQTQGLRSRSFQDEHQMEKSAFIDKALRIRGWMSDLELLWLAEQGDEPQGNR